MSAKYLLVAGAVFLSACASVTTENRTAAEVQVGFYEGEQYEVRTRQFQGATGPFEQTSVVYRGFTKTCIPDSPDDCERAARLLIEQVDEQFPF